MEESGEGIDRYNVLEVGIPNPRVVYLELYA